MLKGIGPEFQCLKGKGWNFNIRKNSDRIPKFKNDRARNPMLERIGPEF